MALETLPVSQCDGQSIIDLLAHQPPGTFTREMLRFDNFPRSWWSLRIKETDYPEHMGDSPLRRVQSRQRGGEVFNAAVWNRSNGTGDAADNIAAGLPIGTAPQAGCCPPVNYLKRGYLTRGLTRFQWGWQGRLLCASDMTNDLDPMGDLEMEFKGYTEQIDNSKAMFQRNEYFRLCKTKIYVVNGPDQFNKVVRHTVGDPTQIANLVDVNGNPVTGVYAQYIGLDPTIKPTGRLDQSLISNIARWLQTNGVAGVKIINGAHQYEVSTGMGDVDNLMRDVSNVTSFEYKDMGARDVERFALLQGLGSMQCFRNAAYQIDPFALALDNNYDPVPATISVPADSGSGTEDITNPNYDRAPYRVTFVYTDEVFNVAYPKISASPGGNVEFKPYGYFGELVFKVLPELPLGDQGYFYSAIKCASFAAQQRFGAAIIHLSCYAGTNTDCSGVITSY
jgi:hypothetical protein